MPLAFVLSILMWGVVYQGYNAVFPSFYPELFPTRARVSGMAIAQNIGTMLTALLPALFAMVAPPGSNNVPLTIGALAFGVTAIAAIAACSARETYRIHLNDLGRPGAPSVDKGDYRPAASGSPDRGGLRLSAVGSNGMSAMGAAPLATHRGLVATDRAVARPSSARFAWGLVSSTHSS